MKRLSKGFTMIELLIVVAVLGILAVAVLAAINPIEQMNRGKDTASRSDAEQLIGAIDRFYTSNGYYPWVTSASITDFDQPWMNTASNSWTDGATNLVLNKLSAAASEVKLSFVDRISRDTYNFLWVYNRGTQGDSTYVCFAPKSGAFDLEAKNRCENTGGAGLPTDLKGVAASVCGGAANYSCLP